MHVENAKKPKNTTKTIIAAIFGDVSVKRRESRLASSEFTCNTVQESRIKL